MSQCCNESTLLYALTLQFTSHLFSAFAVNNCVLWFNNFSPGFLVCDIRPFTVTQIIRSELFVDISAVIVGANVCLHRLDIFERKRC